MTGVADTGSIAALGNRDDMHYSWAANQAKSITEPLLTCESVLSEAAFHLRSCGCVLSVLDDELLQVAFDCLP